MTSIYNLSAPNIEIDNAFDLVDNDCWTALFFGVILIWI